MADGVTTALGEPGNGPVLQIPVGPGLSRELSPNRVYNGAVTIAAANTRVRFPNHRCTRARVIAEVLAAPPLYLGDQAVSSANGYPLRAIGQEVVIELSYLGNLHLVGAGVGDQVRFIAT